MRLKPDQLEGQLRRGLAHLYLVFGDEPLLIQEAADSIRARARKDGFDEREVLTVEPGFDWDRLSQTAASGSLFASHRLLELRLGEAKPGDAGGKALRAHAADPPPDTLLLISAARIDPASQNSAWFKALDQAGMVVQVWPVGARALPDWIGRRMRAGGLIPEPGAAQWLAERVEGNLLAAAQEIDRLAILHEGAVNVATLEGIGDSARYNVFDLVDSALAGEAARVSRILRVLEAEGVDPVLCCWALHRELKVLTQLALAARQGQRVEALMPRLGVRERRKPLLRAALKRLGVGECRRLLGDCARLDRLIKGSATGGTPWEEMLDLVVRLAGVRLPATFFEK